MSHFAIFYIANVNYDVFISLFMEKIVKSLILSNQKPPGLRENREMK